MEFSTNWPKESGYYWFVDTSYPQPKIGYLLRDTLFDGQTPYNRDTRGVQRFIRIGDRIEEPACEDCKILD